MPEDLEFDVEIKYAWVDKEETVLNWMERNEYLDTILKTVFDHVGKRKIFFSCFCPEVCALLCAKQAKFPVYLLTGSGMYKDVTDMRSLSVAASVDCAAGCMSFYQETK